MPRRLTELGVAGSALTAAALIAPNFSEAVVDSFAKLTPETFPIVFFGTKALGIGLFVLAIALASERGSEGRS